MTKPLDRDPIYRRRAFDANISEPAAGSISPIGSPTGLCVHHGNKTAGDPGNPRGNAGFLSDSLDGLAPHFVEMGDAALLIERERHEGPGLRSHL